MVDKKIIQKHYAFISLSALFVLAFIMNIQPIYEFDVWWHLKAGQWMVQHHRFFTTDFFSAIHPEREWKTFNWLFEVFIYGLYQIVGLFGLRVFISSIVVVGYGIWFIFFLRETKNYLASFTLLVFLMTLYAGRIQIRPHVFNLIFEGLLLLFLQSGGILETWKKRIGFFVVAVLWANIHHPFATIGTVIIWTGSVLQMVIAIKRGDLPAKATRTYGWPMLLSAIAIFCNPYGASLFRAEFTNIAPVYSWLAEWMPPLSLLTVANYFQGVIAAAAPILTLLICLIVLLVKKKRGKLLVQENMEWFATSIAPIAFLAMSQTSLRFVYLSTAALAWIIRGLDIKTGAFRKIFIAACLGLSMVLIHFQIAVEGGGIRSFVKNLRVDILPGLFPGIAADVIHQAHLNGGIGTLGCWGGYLLWFADPPGGVSADTRNNLSPEVFHLQDDINRSIRSDGGRLLAAIDQLGTEIAVLPFGAFPFSHWPTERWIRIAHDPNGEVFLRTDSEDMNYIRNFFELSKVATPKEIQEAATHYFGEQYYQSQAATISMLQKDGSEAAIHKLAFIEAMAGHQDVALNILHRHTKSVPSCLQGLTEIAGLLHDSGNIKKAREVLEPSIHSPQLPLATYNLWVHLESHKP